MPYVPNGRMDRVKKDTEVFTLKYFAQMINQMHFKTVKVLDPHSHVLEALLHRVVIESPRKYIEKTIESIKKVSPDLVLYFPDEGAMKRYSHMFSLPFCYGLKKRNWENGEILGICVVTQGIDIREKNIVNNIPTSHLNNEFKNELNLSNFTLLERFPTIPKQNDIIKIGMIILENIKEEKLLKIARVG